MKKLIYLIVLALILGLVLTGCLLSNIGQVPTTEQNEISYLVKHTEEDPFVTDLIAGGGNPKSAIDVGDVLVWNDGDTLYVKYVITEDGWCLTETHLHVATNSDDIPQKKGNPTPGHFDYNDEHDCVTEVLYEIPLHEDWKLCEADLFIAAHAVVQNSVEIQEKTAWGEGPEFPGRNWATYFNYCEFEEEWPEGGTISVAYEDLPIGGDNDYDYNDFVVDIDTLATFFFGTPTNRKLIQIDFTVRPEARGAGFDHRFHILIPADTFSQDGTYTLEIIGVGASTDSGTFNASEDNDFIVIPDTREALGSETHSHTNTLECEGPTLPTTTAVLTINFSTPFYHDFSQYDPYSASSMHGEGLFFDPYLEVDTESDDNVFNSPEYEIHTGDKRILTVPDDWRWPEEDIAIWNVYTGVSEGDPPIFTDVWWALHNECIYGDNVICGGSSCTP